MSMVYLNALGILCALGNDVDTVRAVLYTGSSDGMQTRDDFIHGRTVRVGVVETPLPEPAAELAAWNSRNNRLLLAAVAQIRPQIDAAMTRFGAARIGIVLGTGTSGIAEGETATGHWVRNGTLPAGYDYRQQEISSPSEFLSRALAVTGPAWTVSTACTSSAKALSAARRLLRSGLCDAVITGGVDTLCRLTLNGFGALESVSQGLCNPSSRNRDGINIGEGAAIFLMTREPGPVTLLGIGESSDAHHISAPDPEGRGAELAMRQALTDAEITASDVDYLNLHGTATPQNDLVESHAVARVFGTETPCSSTKPLVGHALGAAGAIEAAFCWMLLMESAPTPLPPHIWDGEADPALAPLNLCVAASEPCRCDIAASNSFAFGGNNICLIMGRG